MKVVESLSEKMGPQEEIEREEKKEIQRKSLIIMVDGTVALFH
jgi:hypothetical protein